MREICLDTETTGLDPKDGHKIIEIGCVELINKVRTGKTFHAYINPRREVPQEAFRIHGISTEFLQDKPIFDHVVYQFLEFIQGATLVIHNADFDMKFLNFELRNCGLEMISRANVVDSLTMARTKFPGAANSLDALCKRFSVDLSRRKKHGALLDSELLADIYIELMGGSQTGLQFDSGEVADKKESDADVKNSTATNAEISTKKILPAREFPISEEQLALHMEFIKKNFKTNLWYENL